MLLAWPYGLSNAKDPSGQHGLPWLSLLLTALASCLMLLETWAWQTLPLQAIDLLANLSLYNHQRFFNWWQLWTSNVLSDGYLGLAWSWYFFLPLSAYCEQRYGRLRWFLILLLCAPLGAFIISLGQIPNPRFGLVYLWALCAGLLASQNNQARVHWGLAWWAGTIVGYLRSHMSLSLTLAIALSIELLRFSLSSWELDHEFWPQLCWHLLSLGSCFSLGLLIPYLMQIPNQAADHNPYQGFLTDGQNLNELPHYLETAEPADPHTLEQLSKRCLQEHHIFATRALAHYCSTHAPKAPYTRRLQGWLDAQK